MHLIRSLQLVWEKILPQCTTESPTIPLCEVVGQPLHLMHR